MLKVVLAVRNVHKQKSAISGAHNVYYPRQIDLAFRWEVSL
jgi:hypothetical protein